MVAVKEQRTYTNDEQQSGFDYRQPPRLMNNRVSIFKRRPDQAITKDNQPSLKAINTINGIVETVFTPKPPLVIPVATTRQSYSLNGLVQELCALFFAFLARILHGIGFRLHRVMPVKGNHHEHDNKEYRIHKFTLMHIMS